MNTELDPDHCGTCGGRCDDDLYCVSGVCKTECPEEKEVCGDECVDLETNPKRCGSCSHACASDEQCESGHCVAASCPDGDGDGHVNAACGGDDCNDSDPDVNSDAREVCDDHIDNDCDGQIDAEDDNCPKVTASGGCNASGSEPLALVICVASVLVIRRRRAKRA
ncbi:MopE-related protein [Myxococcota bacterium]